LNSCARAERYRIQALAGRGAVPVAESSRLAGLRRESGPVVRKDAAEVEEDEDEAAAFSTCERFWWTTPSRCAGSKRAEGVLMSGRRVEVDGDESSSG